MSRVVLSSKYRITIPPEMRKRLGLRKGQAVFLIPHSKSVALIPDHDIAATQGAFPEAATDGFREETDRLRRPHPED